MFQTPSGLLPDGRVPTESRGSAGRPVGTMSTGFCVFAPKNPKPRRVGCGVSVGAEVFAALENTEPKGLCAATVAVIVFFVCTISALARKSFLYACPRDTGGYGFLLAV